VDVGIGPAYQGFVDATDFRPVDGRGTRLLADQDSAALERLRAACDATEWKTTGVSLDRHELTFGCFDGGELISAGMLEKRGEDVVFVRIITRPDHRERGYGRAVVSAMTAHALAHRLIPRYQTLFTNAASVAIARSLGYVEYGATLAVRLRELDAPE
jgi:GNAT superfamily N-acetyltransferase